MRGAGSDAGARRELPTLPGSWLIAGVAALTLLTASRVYLSLAIKGIAEPPEQIVIGEALRWILWLPVVLPILTIERRWGFYGRPWPAALATHACTAAGVLLLHTSIMSAIGTTAGWYFALDTVRATVLVQLVHEAPAAMLVYGAIIGGAHARRHAREREARSIAQANLEARLARERLRNLQMQLHPHFLFNALHAIGGIIREGDRTTAVQTVSELGELLRRSLDRTDRQLVTLDEELDFIGAYLRIQKARYGSRLDVSISADPAARRALVPNLILQPLVENAIRHGTSRAESGGTVVVSAAVDDGKLRLEVSDDGPGPPADDPAEGIGLSNTRERLVEMYDRACSFRMERRNGRGTSVRIELPLRLEGETARA